MKTSALCPEGGTAGDCAPDLDRLLEHPAIWRGRNAAGFDTHPTGSPTLDAALPGGGWPAAGLTEILTPQPGLGELRLLLPLLRQLGASWPPRWIAWISPPFEPYAPALVGHGLPLERQLVVRTRESAWAIEQALESGGCALVLGWLQRVTARELRRLQWATQRRHLPAFVFRDQRVAAQASPAQLRLQLTPQAGGMGLQLLKSRGGRREPFMLRWEEFDGGA